MIKKITAAFLAAVMCILSLGACAKDSSPAVMTLCDFEISANKYNYWASTSKANILSSYSDTKDTAEFWAGEYEDGVSYSEYFDSLILDDVKKILVCQKIYNDERLSLSDEAKKTIDEGIAMLISEYAEGKKDVMNASLAPYGANVDILSDIYTMEAKRECVFEYLFGEEGKLRLDDVALEEYYKDNFLHIQIIYVNDKYEYVLDGEGNYTTNTDGTYATRALTEEAKAEKAATVEAVKAALEAGEDFDAVYEEYSEMKSYPGGYYFSPDMSYSAGVFYELCEVAADLEEGDWTAYDGASGTYVIKLLENEEGAWKADTNGDFFADFESTAARAAFSEYLSDMFEDIKVDSEYIAKYSVSKVEANFAF